MRASHPLLPCLLVLAGVAIGCAARIPPGRYGVEELRIEGTKELDPHALRACLATREREALSIDLSKEPAPTCGMPPFEARRIHLALWRWRWTEWPLYDPSIFERDLSRIERWYQARGYYSAHVLDASSSPEDALLGTATGTNRISLRVRLVEGEPVRIIAVSLQGAGELEESVGKEILTTLDALELETRFDEALYDLTQARLLRTLRDAGYAEAAVDGRVDLDPTKRTAAISFTVRSGPLMEVGDVCIEGHGKLPPKLVLQAADLRPGRPFSESDIEDARTRIYQLRVLSEVEITAGRIDPSTGAQRFADDRAGRSGEFVSFENGVGGGSQGEADEPTERVCRFAQRQSKKPQVPIEIRVKPAKLYRLGVGAGLQIGVEDGQRAINATQQWDVHLFGYAEAHNFLGGLRRLRVEERPKVIFLAPFPWARDEQGARDVRLGNNLSMLLEWPAFLEARTLLRLTGSWDRGPDPYGGKFIRDDFDVGIGPTRSFFRNRLLLSGSVHVNHYVPRSLYGTGNDPDPSILQNERYNLLFLQQLVEWDTRDNRNSPSRGTYARLEIHEALPPSNWHYVRITPEIREYVGLPYGLVLAARAGFGAIAMYHTTAHTEELKRLGPRPYRLRGGGPYSVRGVQAGLLGLRDGQENGFPGGTRSWLTSVELRVPLSDNFGIATFVDAGDVDGGSAQHRPRFRFDHPNTTLGAGLRYKTLVGPIRLDLGFLVPGLQGNRVDASTVRLADPLFRFNGAVHLTIGEAF